jgi:hypothetical protein
MENPQNVPASSLDDPVTINTNTIPPSIEKERENKQKRQISNPEMCLLCDRVTPLQRDLSNHLISRAVAITKLIGLMWTSAH